MPSRSTGTSKSKGRASSDIDKHPPGHNPHPPRAHRGDTTEAITQRRRLAKTHPTRSPSKARKS